MKRSIYLKKTDWKDALKSFHNAFEDIFPLAAERITVQESLHRITCEEIAAGISSPAFDAAAMDGIAVQAERTYEATATKPLRLTVGKDCVFVDTGAPIEKPFDAVIKVEDISVIGDTIEITHSIPPGKDVRFAGEDFTAGERIVPAHHRIRPVDIAAMLGCGVLMVKVRRKPRVSIMPTGSEIVAPGETMKLGSIIDSNSYLAENLIRLWGGEPDRGPIVRNEKELLFEGIAEAVHLHDIVIVIAGSSAGSEDLTRPVLEEMGTILVHGVDLMPGKPVILARIEDTPVVGLPGYPVSAYMILDIFVSDIVAMALGTKPQKRVTVKALLSDGLPSKLGMDEIVRVKLVNKNGTLHAMPLNRGAGILKSIVQADGFIRIPKDEEGINAGCEVTVEVLNHNYQLHETAID